MNNPDYKTIDTTRTDVRKAKEEKIKKRIKIAVSCIIFLPLVYFIFINFVLGLNVPEKMYAILGILYLAIFTIVIFMSMVFPHS